MKKSPNKPAWVIAHAKRTEFGQFPGRDTVYIQAGVDCSTEATPVTVQATSSRQRTGRRRRLIGPPPTGN